MRTRITLSCELIAEIKRITGESSAPEAVREALIEYIRFRRRIDLLNLEGKIVIARTNSQIEAMDDQDHDVGWGS